jgi:hypothetical protein
VAAESRPPSESFRIVRRCPRCRAPQRFDCTGKFRVNANRKLIDVWLLFACHRCGATAKLTVVERVPVSRVGRSRLRAFQANDPELVRSVAGDRARLERSGFSVVTHTRAGPTMAV